MRLKFGDSRLSIQKNLSLPFIPLLCSYLRAGGALRYPLAGGILFLLFISCIQFLGRGWLTEKPPPSSAPVKAETNHSDSLAHLWHGVGAPVIRVGILEGYKTLYFSVSEGFSIIDDRGSIFSPGEVRGQKWSVHVRKAQPAVFEYGLFLTAFQSPERADGMARELRDQDFPVFVQRIGQPLLANGDTVEDNSRFRVFAGPFSSPEEARRWAPEFEVQYTPQVVTLKKTPSRGRLILSDRSGGRLIPCENFFRIIPRTPEGIITLYDVQVGNGFHWETVRDQSYRGTLEVRLDDGGKLLAVSEVLLDVYLKGVVPSEMSASYPPEALKAQAVAARSEVLAKLGLKHLNDPYDFCASVHCQVYSGITKEDERTDDAVEATVGMVLTYHGDICDAVYSAVCGGHTEDKAAVWGQPESGFLMGQYDVVGDKPSHFPEDLTREEDVQQWVTSYPQVNCNLKGKSNPYPFDNNGDKFRWRLSIDRESLERIIEGNIGQDLGILLDIVPLSRGVSGRLKEIEIRGTKDSMRIKKELNIRNILSEDHLKSACFVVDRDIGEDGFPVRFVFTGAGWGHGVGMCQAGAGVMAAEGKTFQEILLHYFQDVEITKLF